MRIAMVVTGGVARGGRHHVIPVLLSLIEQLGRRHDVVVYVLRYLETPTTYPLLGATVHDLGRPRGIVCQYRALVGAMRRDGPFDVVQGHWILPSGLVAALAGRRLGVPSIVVADSGEFIALPGIGYGAQVRRRQRLAVRLASRLASRVLVCTRYQQALADGCNIPTQLVPLGIDTTRFTPPLRPPATPPWRLLHVGSINAVKDHDTLLHAVRLLLDRQVGVHVDIIGEDRRQGSVQALATRLGVDGVVTFHGVQESDAVAACYQRAHLLVLPSRHEAAGVVVLEAAACGVPAVGSLVGYIADWHPHMAAGVAPGDAPALASAIQTLLNDPVARSAMGERARCWTAGHDVRWTVDALETMYHSCRQ